MKSKILMIVLAVVFLAAGSAMAIPTVNYSINGNDITYDVINDLADLGIYRVGFGPAADSVDGSWILPTGVSYWSTNGKDWFNVNPAVYGYGSIDDITISYNTLPDVISYTILLVKQTPYTGTDLTFDKLYDFGYVYYVSGRYDITSVPEPATLLMLGLGLLGMAGLKRKLGR